VEKAFISELAWKRVILPMVLQMGGSMVLQRSEREGKADSPPFWAFVSLTALMRKHGFAEKLQV
jgi:hypothetical protein